jgi:hypothetical protein
MRRTVIWMIRFIDTLYTVFGTTGNYSAITDLQFPVNHSTRTRFLTFTSRILAMDL